VLDTFAYAAGRYRFAHEDWRYEARMQMTYRLVGGDSFEARRAISFQGTRELNPEWLFRARYRFSRLDGLGSHDGLDGAQWRIVGRFAHSRNESDNPRLAHDVNQVSVGADIQF
jgi:hypothetical protein